MSREVILRAPLIFLGETVYGCLVRRVLRRRFWVGKATRRKVKGWRESQYKVPQDEAAPANNPKAGHEGSTTSLYCTQFRMRLRIVSRAAILIVELIDGSRTP